MAVTTSAIRAESLFYSDRETKFLGDRELIIKSSSDSIKVRFQRWYSFSTNSSRFPSLRNIFLGGGEEETFASCLFSIYHTKVETVARVYRPIFYSLSSPPLHSLFIFRSHPFVTLHYLLLRNVVDAFFFTSLRRENFWGDSLRDFFYS